MKEEDKKLVNKIRGVVLNEQSSDPTDDDEFMGHMYKHYITEEALTHLRSSGATAGYAGALEHPLESLSRMHYENAKERYHKLGGQAVAWPNIYNDHMSSHNDAMCDYYDQAAADANYREPRGGF